VASLAIAAEHATFAKPEITLGFPPLFGGSQRLAWGINLPIDEGLAVEAACFAATVPTDGVRDGLRSFLDRPSSS
jgi:enoyl-CoA hydratase/carnithine racemase